MPHLDTEQQLRLRDLIEKRFGSPIRTKGDCDLLTRDMQRRTSLRSVSSQTLRRLFGLIPGNKSGFETGTLTILAKYLGLADYEELIELMRKGRDPILEAQCRILEDLVKGLEPCSERQPWLLSDYFVGSLVSGGHLSEELLSTLMRQPYSRTQLMESFPMMDWVNNQEYRRLFEEYLRLSEERERAQGELFVYGLLGLGAYMSEDWDRLSRCIDRQAQVELTPQLHQLPVARRYGLLLLRDLREGRAVDGLLREIMEVRERYGDEAKGLICNFDYILFEHLLLTDRWDLIAELGGDFHHEQSNTLYLPGSRQHFHHQVWRIYSAAAQLSRGDAGQALRTLRAVDLSQTMVGWECTTRLQHHLVLLHCRLDRHERYKVLEEVRQLSTSTGFTLFLTLARELTL